MILASYQQDGTITGFQHVEKPENTTLQAPTIEVTPEQHKAYFASPTTCGVANGVFSTTWTPPVNPVVEEAIRVATIKRMANEAVLGVAPIEKQLNMLAEGLELVFTIIDTGGAVLAGPQRAQVNHLMGEWSRIKAIREKSNQAEAAGTQPQDVIW